MPISVQALGTRRLDQLNISNFEDYTKQLPSVSFQTAQPGFTIVYMRGVADRAATATTRARCRRSASISTSSRSRRSAARSTSTSTISPASKACRPAGHALRRSSEAGTIRIITNKPELGRHHGRVDGEINSVAHGGIGGKLEGMINLPIASNIAFRGVGFYQHDAGYIDNVLGTRTYCGDVLPIEAAR